MQSRSLRVLFRKISREFIHMQRDVGSSVEVSCDFRAVAVLGSLSWMAEEADELSTNHQESFEILGLPQVGIDKYLEMENTCCVPEH
ncbi:uncharacterized protein Bfra_003538 [Botrytis fragariae]|uniref:Uncharacterized protein n=1 Tax=Botrytis fragariae TaxID=1964551 RepID=A0A8H6EK24_9HELO|nr:uncharacterized protein Bfra_003538 [Botrytis fragariae]KAF5875084.1 hypothetical protein Bfra_003538 [Botrytis fragariae]